MRTVFPSALIHVHQLYEYLIVPIYIVTKVVFTTLVLAPTSKIMSLLPYSCAFIAFGKTDCL